MQTGAVPGTSTDIANNINLLTAEFQKFGAAAATALGIISAPFITALTGILRLINGILFAFNSLASIVGFVLKQLTLAIEKLPFGKKIIDAINKDIEKAGGAMTPEIIERLKNRNKEADIKATEIIKNLGINPNSQEGKAFAEGLKVGGEKAVEELFGRNRKPGTPMKAPSGEKGPKFGFDEAKNFGIEYEIPKGSGT